ncbi:MAG: glycosyl hydrolase family 57, partial [Alphaproteobacteria bacterium]|nr:glycosyl hydrolase family 57 [Alphaproteobacteria bacterium]
DRSGIDFDRVGAGFAIALHMHQPMVPAAGELTTAPLISNLQHMLDHSDEGENHNAPMFIDCYERMGRIIPELVEAGHRPRVMLEYSGCLLWGLQQMGRGDVIESLRRITTDDRYWPCVEWLGMPWGHPVAPSTPAVDFRRHVQAHQQHFAGLFGLEALSRVRGFSPPEMALPNHPDLAYEFVKALRDFGYQWVLVQEHTVERPGGGPVTQPHLPRRLVCRNSRGEVAEITAIIKTQGSDTKLVGQMQPYYEACGLGRVEVSGRSIPPLVTQISDGENGGVIMNEFPGKYLQVMRQAPGSDHPPINVSEYLAYLHRAGVGPGDFEPVQPLMQHRVWANFEDAGPNALDDLIVRLERDDPAFHMEGGSWTSDRSWVAGYEHVLGPMETASMMFRERVDPGLAPTDDDRYRNALYHLLLSQTSCYRYWGGGIWTERGREICRRAMEIIRHDFPVEVG